MPSVEKKVLEDIQKSVDFCNHVRSLGPPHSDSDEITITLENGRPFTFPRNLDDCVMGVFGGEYKYPRFPDEPTIKTVLDIGANVGAFAVWGAARWPEASFVCYEPHPYACSLLERNTKGMPVTIDPRAVALSPTVTLYEGADMGQSQPNLGLTTIDPTLLSEPMRTRYVVHAIHPYELPDADILKIDAEGVELAVLTDYRALRRVWAVLLEFHRADDVEPIRRILSACGLKCFRHDQKIDCVGRMMYCRTKSTYNRKTGVYE